MMYRILPRLTFIAVAIIVCFNQLPAQEVSIVDELKNIESGDIEEARSSLRELRTIYPDNPSVKFLDAVLSAEASTALNKYKSLIEDYPNSDYADAALYRIFSYYYSIGSYSKAESYLKQLKSDYPSSPYIKAADRSIPDETAEETEPEPVVQYSTESEENFEYTVQAGAFLNIANAQNLTGKLKAEGYYSSIFSKEAGGSILNVVIVGKFKSRDDAQSMITKLETDYNLKGRIIKFNF
jgi:tetratricopeptide (TPR) repeat protein